MYKPQPLDFPFFICVSKKKEKTYSVKLMLKVQYVKINHLLNS